MEEKTEKPWDDSGGQDSARLYGPLLPHSQEDIRIVILHEHTHKHKRLCLKAEQDRLNFSLNDSIAFFLIFKHFWGVIFSRVRQAYNSRIFLSFSRNSLLINRIEQYYIIIFLNIWAVPGKACCQTFNFIQTYRISQHIL
jgi:hypothetical protein